MWIHHLTHIDNLESILERGLISRNQLKQFNIKFNDTADKRIIGERNDLNNYIPFHINYLQKKYSMPYNWKVLKNQSSENMIFLNYNIDDFSNNELDFYLYHPISKSQNNAIKINDLMGFKEKLLKEEKKLQNDMGYLDFSDNKTQQFLMSEVLIKDRIYLSEKWKIGVFSFAQKQIVEKKLEKNNLKIEVFIDDKRYFYR